MMLSHILFNLFREEEKVDDDDDSTLSVDIIELGILVQQKWYNLWAYLVSQYIYSYMGTFHPP